MIKYDDDDYSLYKSTSEIKLFENYTNKQNKVLICFFFFHCQKNDNTTGHNDMCTHKKVYINNDNVHYHSLITSEGVRGKLLPGFGYLS